MARRRSGIYVRDGWYHARWPFRGSLRTRVYAEAVLEYDRRLKSLEGVPHETKSDEVQQAPTGTVAAELEAFRTGVLPNRRVPRAARDAVVRLRRSIVPISGRVPDTLTMDDMEAVRRHLDTVRCRADRRLSPQSVHDHLRDLKGFLRWLQRRYTIRCLPFDRGIMPRLGDRPSRAPAPEDVAAFFRVAKEPVRSFAIVLFCTGLRPAELRGLKSNQVILTSGRPRLFFKATKNRRNRTVWLPKPAVEVLYRWMMVTGKSEHVCPWRPVNLVGPFVRASRAAGVHITPGMFRHLYGNLYCDRGGNLEALQQLYGHASIRTTQHYRRPSYEFVMADWQRIFGELTLNCVTPDEESAEPESPASAEVNQ